MSVSFNNFVSFGDKIDGQRQAELSCGVKIDDELHLGRFFDWKIAGLCAAQNAIDVACGPAIGVRNIGTLGYETTIIRKLAGRIDRRYARRRRERDDGRTVVVEHRTWKPHKTIAPSQGCRAESVYLLESADRKLRQTYAKSHRSTLCGAELSRS